MSDNFFADKSDLEVARFINLALLVCNGISEEDAGFDMITTMNETGVAKVAKIIGEVRAASAPGLPDDRSVSTRTLGCGEP